MSLRYPVKNIAVFSRGRAGFSLIEILVALFLGSLITAGASLTLQQIYVLVPRAEDYMLATRQVQFAGDWIVRDALAAQVIIPADNVTHNLNDHVTRLVLSRVRWTGDNTTITYSVDANCILRRIAENSTASYTIQIADNITSLTTLYKRPTGQDRKILTVTIVSTVSGVSENRTYQTAPRSY
jgi:prepilin-type N-terminal cleavage/methylation domain-containing protein